MAEYLRQACEGAALPPAWGATFLCWLKQEMGLGRVLLAGLGLETVVKLNSPVQVGLAGAGGGRWVVDVWLERCTSAVGSAHLLCLPPRLQPGDELLLRCSHIDVKAGVWRLDVVPPSQAHNFDRQTSPY